MRTQSGRRVEPIEEFHVPLIVSAAQSGCDVTVTPESERYIVYGKTRYGDGPVAIVDVKETPYEVEPHIIWLPWTTTREKIECINDLGDLWVGKVILLMTLKKFSGFFDHFIKKGKLRKIGFIDGLPKEVGEEIHLYQYVR